MSAQLSWERRWAGRWQSGLLTQRGELILQPLADGNKLQPKTGEERTTLFWFPMQWHTSWASGEPVQMWRFLSTYGLTKESWSLHRLLWTLRRARSRKVLRMSQNGGRLSRFPPSHLRSRTQQTLLKNFAKISDKDTWKLRHGWIRYAKTMTGRVPRSLPATPSEAAIHWLGTRLRGGQPSPPPPRSAR